MYTIEIDGVDKTSLVKSGTVMIEKNADNRSECEMIIQTDSDYVDFSGLDVKVYDGASLIFGGIIKTASRRIVDGGAILFISISSNGYGDIPSRRTISSSYTDQYAGAIVTDIITNVLNAVGYDDNITAGTISNGAYMTTYSAVCKSLKDIFDELADASGFKWYINDSKQLNFVAEDTIIAAAHDIVEGGAFTDFRDVIIDESLAEYCNKVFVRGATVGGVLIEVDLSDEAEITARAAIEGGSGVYGKVIDDSNIQSEADATLVGNNELKRYGAIPVRISFSSFTNDWTPGTILKVNLPKLGIDTDTYCLIESVEVEDIGGMLQSNIIATKRKANISNTQHWAGYPDTPELLESFADCINQVIYNGWWPGYGWRVTLSASNIPIYLHPDNPTFLYLSGESGGLSWMLVGGAWTEQTSGDLGRDFSDVTNMLEANGDLFVESTYETLFFEQTIASGYQSGISTQRTENFVDYFSKIVRGTKSTPTPTGTDTGLVGTKEVDETDIANAKILQYNSVSGKLEYESLSGGGDMLASVYDPTNVAGDAFDVDNHASGTTNKVYTATEQTKLNGIATGAEVNVQPDWNQATNTADDYIKNKPTISGSNTGDQDAADVPITDTADHFTSTDVEGALAELFTNVSSGKTDIATAITDKGGTADGSDTFTELATAIGDIPSGGGNSPIIDAYATLNPMSLDCDVESDYDVVANATPTMTSNTAPSGITSASSEYSSTYAAWKAFDKDNSSYFRSATGTTQWIAYEFPSAKIITCYTLNQYATYHATAWDFQGWNGSSWDTLDSQINQPSAANIIYFFANTTSYSKYRINFTALYTTAMRLYELGLYEAV